MVHHVVIQNIDPDRRDEYIDRYKELWREAALVGCQKATLLRAIENKSRVILLFEWESIEGHRKANRTPGHDRLMEESVYKYQSSPSEYGHYEAEDL